jgi:hypothetical protein
MLTPTISASAIEALVDAITGGTDNTTSIGRCRTQGQIASFMAQCNFDYSQGLSSRMDSLRSFLREVSSTSPGDMPQLFEQVCQPED